MIVLVATYMARWGEQGAIEDALREMAAQAQQEPGCLTYSVQRSVDNPQKYLLYERYVDQAALEAHTRSEHFQRLVLGEVVPRLENRVREFYEPVG